MKKLLMSAAGGLALLAVAALTAPRAGAQDDQSPSIKDVMQKLHKGANSPLAQVKKQLSAANPAWDQIQAKTRDFVILGAGLPKQEPPEGERAHYVQLANEYFQNAKALDDAARTKDAAAAKAAFGKLSASCKSCHQAHKGQ